MAHSRRGFLSLLGGAVTLAGAGLWVPSRAYAGDLSHEDRVKLLYTNQFYFNANGEPQISIGLMEGQSQIRISSTGGLSALPSGDGGTAIAGGGRWRIELQRGRPAESRYAVGLESVPATDARAIGEAVERWKSRGLTVDEREIGSLFGVAGKVLDTRRVLLTTGDHASERDAAREAKLLVQRHGASGRLHPIVKRRAGGRIVAHDLDHDVTITAETVLWFAPRGDGRTTVHGVEHDVVMGNNKREDRTYRGLIYVTIDRHGKLAVVNQVPETDILAGLVPAEIFASAPHHALQAQAIAARGQLLAKIGTRHLDDPYLLCAHQHCQVYAGTSREHPRTNKAVAATRGRVLMRPDGATMVDTVYSANSGGHSEHNEHVWPSPSDPQLRGRPDPRVSAAFRGGISETNLRAWLGGSPGAYARPDSERLQHSYRWTAAIDPAAVPGNDGVPRELGPLRGLEVLARGVSGRATRVRLTGTRGEVDVDGELSIRRALGGLRSSMFLVEPQRDQFGRFVLRGGGHGHGVGMCQHGAMGMAGAKRSVDQILAHYYTGSKLTRLW